LSELEIIPVKINKEILKGDDLTKLILSSYSKSKFKDEKSKCVYCKEQSVLSPIFARGY